VKLIARGRELLFPRRPLVMGIVNLCSNSFCGDGITDPVQAVQRAHALIAEGAEIIDIGAESARTDDTPVSEEEEIARLCAFITLWRGEALLSINTWRPAVARAVLARGGDLLNDISGLPTAENARICAEAGAALLIMHTVGAPKVPHTHVTYEDVLGTLQRFFEEKIALATSAGLPRAAIVLDPGLDFAKQCPDNLRILREAARLHAFHRPILLPVSRKTFIGEVLEIADPAQRDAGTVACIVQGMLTGAQIFRVHNVRAAVQTVRTLSELVN
jgi:dihydropteroate synthase